MSIRGGLALVLAAAFLNLSCRLFAYATRGWEQPIGARPDPEDVFGADDIALALDAPNDSEAADDAAIRLLADCTPPLPGDEWRQ